MVRTGASEADAATDYYTAETTRSEKSSWRYFHAEPTDTAPVTVTFESNGGTPMDSITVNFGEKYGKLPSSSVTGLSGGDSNWYLIDEKGNVTDTKITNATTVAIAEAHKLFVKRKVLAPTLKVTLEVPGAVSDGYQYYVPDHSQRILTVTINNQNTDILDYTYQWYKDGNAIEGAAQEKLTLDGNVSDSGIYTVKVTATLIDNTGIVVTSDTATAEKEQKVKILHAANMLYYHANEGEGGPTSNFTGGTAVTVSKDEPSRSGYLFNGWNTKADGTGESYDAGSTYTFTEDNGNGGCSITLYAQWIKAYDIYVGGVQITDANKADVFENGKVSYDADHSTLTIKDWYYQGEGYQYGSDTNDQDKIEYYSAAIYSKDAITIKLEGDNVLKNTFNDSGEDHYGGGIIADGSVKIIGGGSLGIYGAYAINAAAGITIDDIRLYAKTTDHAVNAIGGELIINHAVLEVIAESDGIYANKEITITDSIVNIVADADGIYSYDGYVAINCTKVSVNNDPNLAPALTGTKVSVKSKEGKGIFAYKGLEINDKLTVSVPDGAKIGDVYVENGDYTYYTVKSGSTVAKEIVIEPFAYTVTITGFGFEMAIPVPSGMSLNEAYGEDYFADLNPTNENYIFGGWYKDGNCTAGNEFDFAAAVTSDITVYPKWIPILYTVVVDNAEGGEVFVAPQTAQKGEIVIITPKPDRNKEVDAITVTDKNGNAVAVIQNDDGTYSFTQPESEVVIKVTYRDKQTGTAGGDTGKNNNEPFDNPQTGDNSNLWLWFALALVSGGCLFGTALYSKKKNRAEEDY